MPKSNLLLLLLRNPAVFIIETDGDGNGNFEKVRGMQRSKADKKTDAKAEKRSLWAQSIQTTDDGTGGLIKGGQLFVEVTGADDGSGTAEVEIVSTGQGEGMYPDDEDSDGDGNTRPRCWIL